jgi:hypothetical protein
MKKFSKLFISLLAAGSLASCSSDNFDGPVTPQPGEADGVNMKISISLPASSGTRAEGDATTPAKGDPIGYEDGQTWENNVNKVLVVLTDESDKLIASATTDITLADYNGSDEKFTSVSTFNASVLANYIDGLGADVDQAPVRVYIFCNPSTELVTAASPENKGKTDWREKICILSEDKLGRDSNTGNLKYQTSKDIPMANAEIVTSHLPRKSAILSGAYADKSKAFPMGDVKVIRSIARFDYKAKNTDNIYKIEVSTGDGDSDKGELDIQLTNMALVNMSNNFYYLHRTSSDNEGTNPKYCGEDTRGGYIVDSDWAWKKPTTWEITKDYTTNFLYPLYKNGEQNVNEWNRIPLSELTTDDKDTPWDEAGAYKDYKIWRYVTENTIPGANANQKNGISTGVVFRGIMRATSTTPKALSDVLTGSEHKPIYVYSGIIYATWDEVKKEAAKEEKAGTDFKAAFDKCKVEGGEPTVKAAKEAGFTVYEYYTDPDDADNSGYATLYYYWNRHWDNGEIGQMGTMEFAVVRNNVYKLSVEEISGLGRPRNPEGDPDPVEPNDPDEKTDVNIKLSCEIKKWTVRANGIRF